MAPIAVVRKLNAMKLAGGVEMSGKKPVGGLIKSLCLVILIGLAGVQPAIAQEIKPLDVYQDPHGIDLTTNHVSTAKSPSISIPAAPELTFRDLADFIPMIEVKTGTPEPGIEPEIFRVTAGSLASDAFATCTTDTCYSVKGTGSQLQTNNDGSGNGPPIGLGGYLYTQGGTGTFMRFEVQTEIYPPLSQPPVKKYLTNSVTMPGGKYLNFQYESAHVQNATRHRPTVVTSSSGFELRFTYWSNQADTNWGFLRKAEIVAQANPAVALASLEFNGNSVTDIGGRVFECVCMPSIFQGLPPEQKGSRLKLPGETDIAFTTSRMQNSQTRTVTSDGVTYTYVSTPDQHWPHVLGYGPDGTWKRTMDKITVTGPDGYYMLVDVTNVLGPEGKQGEPRRRIDSITDSQNRTTQYQYTYTQRLKKVIYPEGNAVEVNYDTFGNLVSRRAIAKSGSGQPDLVEYADHSYFGNCSFYSFTCYSPTSVWDAKGNKTDFTYLQYYGGLLTQLDPLNAQNRRRKVKNTWSDTNAISGETCPSGGGAFGAGPPTCVPRLLRAETCETDASGNELTCGTASSFVRTFTYFGATSLPASETVTDGAGNAPLTTTYGYDAAGRLLSTDGPLPGADDATFAQYDPLGRKVWEIGPNGESGRRSASKMTYRLADDQVSRVETGTVSDPAANGWAPTSQTDTIFNARRLATGSTVSAAGGAAYAVTQVSHDARNREDCTAVRMNPAAFLSLPASACSLGSPGTSGPDRITKKIYDTESRVLQIKQGVSTTLQRDYATYTFTANGKTASMTDARGYRAEMRYDGFDRQTHWYFPHPQVAGVINTADYEAYAYDANGNRTSLRKRDGSMLTFAYDGVNQMTRKTVPERSGLSSTHSRDVFYQYDVRGLQTAAQFDGLGGEGLTTSYDRYGRPLSNSETMDGFTRPLDYTHDAAGNRTSIWHKWDGALFTYTYGSGGWFDQLRDPYSNVLVDYNYNARNELAGASRALAAPDQTWSYDPIGRLQSTGWGDAGANSVAWSFTRNPASQILTETQSNDAYSWTGHAPVDRSYAANGLNQYIAVSGVGYCHDANGNLTADNSYAYLYDVENRLVEMRARVGATCPTTYTGQIKASLRYDPLGRLHEVTNFIAGVSQGPTRFLYDGDALVAEFDGAGSVLRRHVHGPNAGVDDPLIEYANPYVAPGYAYVRFLYADARGSIVYRADSANTSAAINTYDEYGVPGSANRGRFQYTGQAWLAELGMYYYKARIYSPTLGRFLQTDPIGYEDNNNLYAYVANDPVNKTDPAGMCAGPLAVPCIVEGGKIIGAGIAAGCALTGACEAIAQGIVGGVKAIGNILRNEESKPARPSDGTPARDGAEPQRVGKKGSDDIYAKPGGVDQANEDFNGSADPDSIVDRGDGIRTGTTPNGDNITVRPDSAKGQGPATVEVIRGSGRTRETDKIRYPE